MSRIEKLTAMALQDESPAERDVARAKLEAMGAWPPPPPPPAPPAAPMPDMPGPFGFTFRFSGTASENINIRWRVTVPSPFGND